MTRKTNRQLQIRTTLKGANLAEFGTLTELLGLTPSGVLKLAVKRLARAELNQTASPGIEIQKKAA